LAPPGFGARTVLVVKVLSLSVLSESDASEIDSPSVPPLSGKITAFNVAPGTCISPPQ
jgi:hypothetical protein